MWSGTLKPALSPNSQSCQCVEERVHLWSSSSFRRTATYFVVSRGKIETCSRLCNPPVYVVDSTSSACQSGEPLVSRCPSDLEDLSALSAMSADRTPQPSRRNPILGVSTDSVGEGGTRVS